MANFLEQIKQKILTLSKQEPNFYQTRETKTPQAREIESKKPAIDSLTCPKCQNKQFVKRGFRKKKREKIQLYQCQNCNRTFTQQVMTTGKHYPLEVILEAMGNYHLGYSLREACDKTNEGALGLQHSTLSTWLVEFEPICKFSRYRPYALQLYPPQDMVETATLAHQQLFRYRFHKAKSELIIKEDIRHKNFGLLKEFLELVPSECPHQFFQTGLRASEAPLTFSKKQMIVRGKQNFANLLCTFVLQSVKDRRRRHEALQKFMLYNDSVTVATEVPVYLTRDDLLHMRTQLGFEIYRPRADVDADVKAGKTAEVRRTSVRDAAETSEAISAADSLPRLITGHIDILQIRNGQIHILDYKPEAAKIQPIDQLTLYAMALSRLTGLRLFEFKCAWFDENDFFEFYPLHVLHKPKKGLRRRKVYTWEGTYEINKSEKKVETIRPV